LLETGLRRTELAALRSSTTSISTSIGLRQLDIPFDQAAELASMCAAGRCDEASEELRMLLVEKRQELARRVAEMRLPGSANGTPGRRA